MRARVQGWRGPRRFAIRLGLLLAAGAGFLDKPFAASALLGAVREALGKAPSGNTASALRRPKSRIHHPDLRISHRLP